MEIGKLLRDIPVIEANLTGKEVTGITSDSRRVQGGELLICIRGLHYDGHAYAADGVQPLSFPVVHEGGTYKHPVSDIRVDYSTPWLLQHKRAIVSAYRTSAYFEYYQDELFDILDSRPERLLDLNMALLRFFIEKTGLAVDLRLTEEFSADGVIAGPEGLSVACEDLREVIHPKRPNVILADLGLEKPYFQVFASKYGFKSDLSIMDLLFNEGPDSILYLKSL